MNVIWQIVANAFIISPTTELLFFVVVVVGGGGCGGSCGGGMGRVGGGGGWELCFAFAWFLSFFLPYIVLNKSWRLLRCFSWFKSQMEVFGHRCAVADRFALADHNKEPIKGPKGPRRPHSLAGAKLWSQRLLGQFSWSRGQMKALWT